MPERVFSVTSRVYFAQDALKKALPFLSSVGKRFVLITESILRTDSQAHYLRDLLRKNGLDTVLYDDIHASSGTLPLDTVKMIRSSRADAVIGFGGIRTVSVARWAAVQASGQGSGIGENPGLPFIALPSSCRNPFLFTPTWYLTFPRSRSGVFEISGNDTLAVIMDPAWFRTLPPRASGTAILASVLDAVEGLFSRNLSPLNESLLSQSVRTLCGSLSGVLEHPDDELQRERAGSGGLLSSLGLASVSIGPVGLLSHVLDTRFGIPKSWSATVLLPHLLEQQAEEHPEFCAALARLFGHIPERMSSREAAGHAPVLVRELLGLIDMPFRFTSFNLTELDMEQAAAETFSIIRNSRLSTYLHERELCSLLRQAG